MDSIPIWLILAFFVIALFYSTVGFGGGSSYLAVLVFVNISYVYIPPQALACNIIVAAGGCWYFFKGGYLNLNKILPFVVLSVPMAYFGGRLFIPRELFCILLGLALIVVGIRFLMPEKTYNESREISPFVMWSVGLPLGGILGFFSGLVGIGGGIFLSPILLLLRWVNPKEAAAAASFFILLNSIFGLMGHLQKGMIEFDFLLPLALAVFIGGQIGSRLGAYHLPKVFIKKGLAVLILYVAVKLVMESYL